MRKLLFSVIPLLCGIGAHACNTCGCAASNQYLGILPELSGSFIGLQYQYRWYNSHHDASEPGKPAGKEYYSTAQLWGRYALTKRIQLFGFVPYQYNTKLEGDARNTLSGIGDITILVNVQVVRPKTTSEKWQHYVRVGGGIKAPTGAYSNSVLGGGDALAPSMQAGTGSWDFVVNSSYTLQHNHAGVNAETIYTMTLPNHQDYKYGNRLSGAVQAFYQIDRHKLRLIPYAGMRYEYSEQDYDNFTEHSSAQYTGGYVAYASVGFQTYYKHWGITGGYYHPVAQHYGERLVQSKGKTEAGVLFLL